MRLRTLAVGLALCAPVLSPAVATAAERVITVEDAVEMALHANPMVLAALSEERKDEDLKRSAVSRMLPSVRVTNEYQHWNSPFGVPFGSLVFMVRDHDTNTFSVTADQPLLGLVHLSHERSAQDRSADADAATYAAMRADLKESVEVWFLRLFEAGALEQIARASEAELTEEMAVTRAKVDAGVLTNADVLRVKVAIANAKQQEIVAHSQGAIARANLFGAIGLPTDASGVDFAEPTSLLGRSRAALPGGTDAQRQALAARPEIRHGRLQVEALGEQYQATRTAMLPEVDAEAGYSNLQGQPLASRDSAYAGVKVVWPVWEWGASYFAQRAAGAHVEAAEHQLDDQRRQIGVEVATELAQAQAAESAVQVAEETIASAEEAYRVTGALLKAGSATTTDLLDSQAAQTQARLNLTRAQYEQAIAKASLARAIGQ